MVGTLQLDANISTNSNSGLFDPKLRNGVIHVKRNENTVTCSIGWLATSLTASRMGSTELDTTNGAQGTITKIVLHPGEPISAGETEHVELQNLPLYIDEVGLDTGNTTRWSGRVCHTTRAN